MKITDEIYKLFQKAQEISGNNAEITFEESQFFSQKEGIFTIKISVSNLTLVDLLSKEK